MANIEGTFLNKKDKRGALRIKKNAQGEYIVNLLTDISESGKYKKRNEGILQTEGGQHQVELRSSDGRVMPIELKGISDGIQVTFIYKAETVSADGLDVVDVVNYKRVSDDSVESES